MSIKQPGLFMYTDLWDNGWRVRVDGKEAPLRKVFHTFKGVELPVGIHEILFYYNNQLSFFIMLMNATFILCVLLLIFNRRGLEAIS